MIDPGLAGKVVLVTGADQPRGIGAAIARAFAAQGGHLFLNWPPTTEYTGSEADEPANAVIAELKGLGATVAHHAADLADPATPERLFDAAEAALGPVEILVNNAAYGDTDVLEPVAPGAVDWNERPLVPFSAASHDRHFAVNSRASALMMQEYARRQAARGAGWGRIINISTSGVECFPGEVSYGASKAALESFSRSAATTFGPLGITVNIVCPGPIQTGWIEPDNEAMIAKVSVLGRLGEPADVADVVVFLASEQARWVTGQRLYVGGGQMM